MIFTFPGQGENPFIFAQTGSPILNLWEVILGPFIWNIMRYESLVSQMTANHPYFTNSILTIFISFSFHHLKCSIVWERGIGEDTGNCSCLCVNQISNKQLWEEQRRLQTADVVFVSLKLSNEIILIKLTFVGLLLKHSRIKPSHYLYL